MSPGSSLAWLIGTLASFEAVAMPFYRCAPSVDVSVIRPFWASLLWG